MDENFDEDETEEFWGMEAEPSVVDKNKAMSAHENTLTKIGK